MLQKFDQEFALIVAPPSGGTVNCLVR